MGIDNRSNIKTKLDNIELRQKRKEEVKEATYSISDLKNTFSKMEAEQEAYRNNFREQIDELSGQISNHENTPENIAERFDTHSERSDLINLMKKKLGAGYEQSQKYIARIDDILLKVKDLAPNDLMFRKELMRAQDKAAEFCEELRSLMPDKSPIVKGMLSTVKGVALSAAKGAVDKANPFDKPINMNDTTDTGVESIRLAYTSVKKGYNSIKTVNNSIKTTVRTVKTTKNVIKGTGTVVYNTARYTGKAIVVTYKITSAIITHTVAALSNPIGLIALAFLIIVAYLAEVIGTLLGGAATVASIQHEQLSMSVGIGDEETVAEQYNQGQTYFNNAIGAQHNGYNSLIDDLYYDPDINTDNELVRVDRYKSDEYDTSWQHSTDDISPDEYENLGVFGFPEWKETLKNDVWDVQISYREAAAIAYVLLQKQSAGGTSNGIHQVEFTSEVFEIIAAHSVWYEETVTSDQYCPGHRCMRNGDTDELYCDGKHEFHQIKIYFNDKNTIMDELGFTKQEKKWAELTYQGYDHNEEIPDRLEGEEW